ncbi:MAG: hypothetical protein JO020_23510 [Chloroflexi bacterium]|nr:hypothetical protein [Chloroflexota bacterium]MBV9897143.1 hypothetical protein [Chloroflexota bacterium]
MNLTISIQAQADYATVKLPTIIGGNDRPGIRYYAPAAIPQYSQFVKAKMVDLTPHLTGDAIKDYPKLANFPTLAPIMHASVKPAAGTGPNACR